MCPGLYQHINRRSVPALRDGLQFKMTGHCSNMILCHIAHETSFILCSVMHRWTTWCSSLLPTFTGPTGSVSSALQNGANLQTLSEEPSCPENKVASCRVVGKKRELPVLLLCDTSQTPGRTNCSGNTNIKAIRKMSFSSPKTSRDTAVHGLDSAGFMFELDHTGHFQPWWFYEMVRILIISQSALREI